MTRSVLSVQDSAHYAAPGRLTRRLVNPLVAAATRAGLDLWGAHVLAVVGRTSGEVRTTPVNVLDHDGVAYLVSPRGHTQWVRNLRVAGRGELRHGRRTTQFVAAEVDDADKADVLRAYLRRWSFEVGAFFEGVGPDASDDELRAAAPRHPVFRIEPTVEHASPRRRPTPGVLAATLAAIAFVAYPALRPFGDAGAATDAAHAFASTAWVVSHLLGVLAFALLPVALGALHGLLRGVRGGRTAGVAAALAQLALVGVLPYYGAEIFGLRAVGEAALARGDASLLDLADAVRLGPGVVPFAVGLLLAAAAGSAAAGAVWRSGVLPRWSGVPLAAGLLLYVPQYLADPPLRTGHGALMALGCLWLAVVLHRRPPAR